jgi:hypothetical protein
MSLDDQLRQRLQARAAAVRAEPDLGGLTRRIRSRERRAARVDRLAVTGAAIVLAGSLGGLVGSLVTARPGASSTVSPTRGTNVLGGAEKPHGSVTGPGHDRRADHSAQTVVSETLASGVSVRATAQALGSPVEVNGAWGSFSICANGEVVTTTVGSGSSFGGGTGVSGLLDLGSGGLEVVASGTVPVASGGSVWWLTLAVGSSVSKVAAEDSSGSIVTTQPSNGLAVVAAATTSSQSWVSAVAETAGGQSLSSMQVLLGDGSKVVDAPSVQSTGATTTLTLGGSRSGTAVRCSVLTMPPAPSSASASQPASPALAAASVIGSFERAFSPDLWQGYASNLAAVANATALGTGAGPAAASSSNLSPLSQAAHSSSGLPVQVRQVTFVSASQAEVVYRLSDGIWRVGSAVLGQGETWRVALGTYCAAVRAGAGVIAPASVASACKAASGR